MRSGLIHSAEQTRAGRSAGRWRAPTPRCVAERGDEPRILPPAQQHRLQTVRLELIGASVVPRSSELIGTQHYRPTATLVGEVLRYAAVDEHGQWCALLGFSSASLHLEPATSGTARRASNASRAATL